MSDPLNIIRGATLENLANRDGVVDVDDMVALYENISATTIITGFVYVSENGRAMQPRQAGMMTDEHERAWTDIVARLRISRPGLKIIMQLAHTGRQTTRPGVVGASHVKCTYFKRKVRPLRANEIDAIVEDFAHAAERAKRSGFDGVQIHAAHGYLIHQFLSPHTNKRTDEYSDKPLLLERIVKSVHMRCGGDFLVWIKVSHGDERGLTIQDTITAVKRVEDYIQAVEVSYGTMEYALNIIRGAIPMELVFKCNPLFSCYPTWLRVLWKKFIYPLWKRRWRPFCRNYNVVAAITIARSVKPPVFVTGGIRTERDIHHILSQGIDGVCLSRPFICQPNLVRLIGASRPWVSACANCNVCTVFCDSHHPTICYTGKSRQYEV